MLGVPCVSSLVGGVGNMLQNGVEGYVYQHDAPYMLAYYVMKIFDMQENDATALHAMTNAASLHAGQLFDRRKNAGTMLEIYERIYNGGGDE